MTDRILPEEFYELLMASFSQQIAHLSMSVHATEEDFMRELLRLTTSLHQVRRMLAHHHPALKAMMDKIIEEDDYSDPELETRRATREDLSTNFLDDVEIDPNDFMVAQTLVLLGQTSGQLPPVNSMDLVQKFSRSAFERGDKFTSSEPDEPNDLFVHRIVQVVNEEMARNREVAKAVS